MVPLYPACRRAKMRSGSAVVAVLLLGACLAVLADDAVLATKVAPLSTPQGAAETGK
jgi:hypothetical protein